MFESFYQFHKKPFQLAPNPDLLYKSPKHLRALTYIEYGLVENVGFIVLTGEVGSGKTTTIQYILNNLGDAFNVAMIRNTNVTAEQMLRMIISEFELEPSGEDKSDLIAALYTFLIEQYEKRRRILLVIDEAQNLSSEALEEVRMLSNLQSDNFALLQILLVGQPELLQTLRGPEMKQFSQRVAVHYHLAVLDAEESDKYINHRVQQAGGRSDLFTPAAIKRIHELSGGVPRSINLICQAALVYGFADDAPRICQNIVRQLEQDQIGVGIRPRTQELPLSPSDGQHASDFLDSISYRLNQLESHFHLLLTTMDDRLEEESDAPQISSLFKGRFLDAFRDLQLRYSELSGKYAVLEKKYLELSQLRSGNNTNRKTKFKPKVAKAKPKKANSVV